MLEILPWLVFTLVGGLLFGLGVLVGMRAMRPAIRIARGLDPYPPQREVQPEVTA